MKKQVRRYERRWEGEGEGGGFLESRQAGGGAMFKRKHIKRGFEFQSSSKMMSVSQKTFHQNKPVKKKKAKKEKRPAVDVSVGVFLSHQLLFLSVSVVSL